MTPKLDPVANMTPLLSCRDVAVSIAAKPVVQGLSLDLMAGQRLAILGRNGVGKTTLLHALAGLRAVDAGCILLGEQTYAQQGPREAAKRRGLLPQHQGDAFTATVLETLLIGRHPHLSRWDWESDADIALAHEALAEVGLAGFAKRSIHTLSGGERQRVALATLLVQQPRVYLLDEPLAYLDPNFQIAVLEMLTRRVRASGAALVMVMHDVNLAAHYSDQALLLYGQGAHETGQSAAVLDVPRLSRLYGHTLRAIRDGERSWFVVETPASVPSE
jgi:iron complex transport system ATP-binding protein